MADFPTEKTGGSASKGTELVLAIVEEVILDTSAITFDAEANDYLYSEFNNIIPEGDIRDLDERAVDQKAVDAQNYIKENKLKNQRYIGAIRYRLSNQTGQDITQLPIAFPLNPNFFTIPLLKEIVEITKTESGHYYERVKSNNSPNYSTNVGILLSSETQDGNSSFMQQKGLDSIKSAEAGIPQSSIKKKANNIPASEVGQYFKRDLRYHSLTPYEGDTILQGRFGQSIRFSGFVNENRKTTKKSSPSIIIRNGENAESLNKIKIYETVKEDVNKDGTSIHITSGDYLTPYAPTTSVKKEANDVFPPQNKLIGDQVVVNTGRLILSTKANEIYIFSKLSTSFYSDDFFTIDTANGYRAVVQDGDYFTKINGQSNNYVVEINDTGKICLGSEPTEVSSTSKVQQAVKGNALAEILDRLIMILTDTYQMKTPSGITDFGPVDKSELNAIKSDLKKILSNNNFLI
jgi:hypothetical protein